MSRRKESAGFTLIEMMIVVTLLAMFATLALPGFQTMINNNRLQSASNEIGELLEYARMEAATRSQPVTVNIGATTWSAVQGNTTLRSILMPEGVTARASSASIAYNARGGANAQATIIVCHDNNTTTARKTIAERSGRVRQFATGMDENNSALASCAP
jgi:type II secretion system protein H